MTPEIVLGLDMGTSSISAVALERSGRVVASVTRAHHAEVPGLAADCAEQDPDRIRHAVVESLRELQSRVSNRSIVGIALTGQMHSTVMLDSTGATFGNVITWQDRRSLRSGVNGPIIESLRLRATDAAMFNTGCRLSPGYLGTTLFALRQLNQLDDRLHRVAFVADWIASELTGAVPVTDRSHAASSGLYDLTSDSWSGELLQAAEIDRRWLPEVCHSGEQIGVLNREMAAATGLREGIPVCNAIGDNQASVLSALPEGRDSILINIGTGGQLVRRLEQFSRELPMDTRILPAGPDPQTLQPRYDYMIVGAGLCGGDAIAWVNRTVRSWLNDFGVVKTESEVWDILEHLDPGSDHQTDLECEPYFRGTRYEPDRRGVLSHIGLSNLTPLDLLQSVLKGIAQSMFEVWKSSSMERNSLSLVVMSGNAVKRNPGLVRAVQQRFEVPVRVAKHSEEAAAGAAMLAGVRLGFWNSLEEARLAVEKAADSQVL